MTGVYSRIISTLGTSKKIIATQLQRSEQITLRLADYSDYEHMVYLSNEGQAKADAALDYLPTQYQCLMNTDNAIPCLIFADDKPVLCSMYYLMSNNTEALGLAARTLPKYQSRGLFHVMGKNMEGLLKQHIPTIERFLTVGEDTEGRRSIMEKSGIIPRFIVQCFIYNLEENTNLLDIKLDNSVKEKTTDDVNKIFSDPKSPNFSVFASRRFVASKPKIPYQVNQENMINAAQRNLVFVSYYERNKVINAITFANSVSVTKGVMIEIFYYGIVDLNILKNHLITALVRTIQNIDNRNQDLKFAIYVSPEFCKEAVETIISDFRMGTKLKSSIFNMFEYQSDMWNV